MSCVVKWSKAEYRLIEALMRPWACGRMEVVMKDGKRVGVSATVGQSVVGRFDLVDTENFDVRTLNSLCKKGHLWFDVYVTKDKLGHRLSIEEFGLTDAGRTFAKMDQELMLHLERGKA